jgi:HK97 family phage prohead protease
MTRTVTRRRRPLPSRRAGEGRRGRERRIVALSPSEVRVTGTDKATGLPTEFTAVVLRYGVLDDYWTKFRYGVFAESLEQRMPRAVWSHDWSDPIGIYDDVVSDTEDGGLVLHARFADFEHVPSARRAASLMADGIIDQFSVGFYRDADEDDPDVPGVVWITRGELVEASPVLAAAVPGTALVGMRSSGSGLLVPMEDVERIIVSLSTGDIGLTDALVAARDAAESGDPADPDAEADTDVEDDPDVEDDQDDEETAQDVQGTADASDTPDGAAGPSGDNLDGDPGTSDAHTDDTDDGGAADADDGDPATSLLLDDIDAALGVLT